MLQAALRLAAAGGEPLRAAARARALVGALEGAERPRARSACWDSPDFDNWRSGVGFFSVAVTDKT